MPAIKNSDSKTFGDYCEMMSIWTTRWVGSTWAFLIAIGSVLVWAVLGPHYQYSDTWQMVINTSTTIVTFLMVFLIQRSQNKESEAVQIKLNEILASISGASNRLINVEDLTERQMQELHDRYRRLAEHAQAAGKTCDALTVEEIAEKETIMGRAAKSKAKT